MDWTEAHVRALEAWIADARYRVDTDVRPVEAEVAGRVLTALINLRHPRTEARPTERTDPMRPDMSIATPLKHACATLDRGKQGHEQSGSVKEHLPELERLGYAEYTLRRGWRLTALGARVSKSYLAEARRVTKGTP